MLLTYSFTINQSTNEAVMAGNISSEQALHILQKIVIAEGIKAGKQAKAGKQKENKDDKVDG